MPRTPVGAARTSRPDANPIGEMAERTPLAAWKRRIGAPSIPDTFVINIGNIMQIWTGGQFRSTPHRVINRGGRDRYSIPVFVYPDADAAIGPLGPDGHAPAGATTTATYLTNSWRRTFPIANIPAP